MRFSVAASIPASAAVFRTRQAAPNQGHQGFTLIAAPGESGYDFCAFTVPA